MADTIAPPPISAAPINAPSPKAGPSAVPIKMPTPPSVDNAPESPATKSNNPLDGMFDKYAADSDEKAIVSAPAPKKKAVTSVKPPINATDPTKTVEPEKPEEAPKDDEAAKTLEDQPKEGEDSKEQKALDPKTAKAGDEKKGKVSPWKLVEEHKSARAKLESEVAELRKLVPNEAARKAEMEEIAAIKKQNQELLEHIKFVDYQKHPEFTEKYEKPYEQAWERIMRRLSGVGVTQPDGSRRAVQASDIAKLSSLPADAMFEQAEEMFGKLSPMVVERVEELKQLWENKEMALQKAKTEGVQKFQQLEQQTAAQAKEVSDFLKKTWESALQEVQQHSKYAKYFNPTEGDEEFNAKLESGYKKADEALTGDPRDPNLSPEQRAQIVKRTAALRNRAAAFGVMNLTIERQLAEIAALKDELEQFKSSEPKLEGDRKNDTPPRQEGYTLDTFEERLRERARNLI